MNKPVAEARDLVSKMSAPLREIANVEKVFCPPFTLISAVSAMLEGSGIGLGAQNMHWADNGAWTGEISPVMLKDCNLDIVDELAAPDMLLHYSLHEPRRGRDDIKAFMTDFRAAFPDLRFWGASELIAEGDYVVGQ